MLELGGEIESPSLINVQLLFLHWILVKPNPCSWSIVCYLT